MARFLLLAFIATCSFGCDDAAVDARLADAAHSDAARADGTGTDGSKSPDATLAADSAPLGDVRADGQAGPAINPTNLTLYINLGDSVAAGSGASTSSRAYRRLLVENDDAFYPLFDGKDLKTIFPGITSISEAEAGSTSAALPGQIAGLPDNLTGETLVTIAIGGN
ncbi:MAG: hypothetical protein JRH20_28875, partial [Deltaproteobacteria bacterium]|nr:hypothetical protein [Deltaproteobacteria bacterium]